jgi:hypothetical protein
MKNLMLMMKSMWVLVGDQADDVVGFSPGIEVVIVGCQGELALGALVARGIVELLVVSAEWDLRNGEVVAVEHMVDQRTLNVLSV